MVLTLRRWIKRFHLEIGGVGVFVGDVQIQFWFEGIGVDMSSGCVEESIAKRPRVSLDLLHSHPNQYFVYENERYSREIAIVDEDTIAYGSIDPDEEDEYYIVASKSQRRFLSVMYVNEDGNAVPVEFDQEKVEILDINGFGERWEGPTLRNGPFGWGKRFDDDGELVYEGFSVFGKYSLYGTEYDPGSHIVLYEGTWCDGLRCGRGESYDRNGSLLCKGEWAGDYPITTSSLTVPDSTDSLPSITSLIISLSIGKKCCGSNSFLVLQSFPRLREVEIGEGSFGKESEEEMGFACVDCPELMTISLREKAMHFFSRMIITGENECMK